MTRTLQWYQRNLPSDDVRINVLITVPDVGTFGRTTACRTRR